MFSKYFVIINLLTTLVGGGVYTTTSSSGNIIKVYNQDHAGPCMVETYAEEGLEEVSDYYDGYFAHASTYVIGDVETIIRYTMSRLYA